MAVEEVETVVAELLPSRLSVEAKAEEEVAAEDEKEVEYGEEEAVTEVEDVWEGGRGGDNEGIAEGGDWEEGYMRNKLKRNQTGRKEKRAERNGRNNDEVHCHVDHLGIAIQR